MDDDWQPTCRLPRDLVRPVPLDPTGERGPTRGQARSRAWRRSSHGLYVPASTDPSRVEQRILEVSARLAQGGAVTGWAALRMHGAAFFDGRDPRDLSALSVPVVCGSGGQLRPSAGLRVLREPLDASQVVVRAGVVCTPVERALADAMRLTTDVREAVVAINMTAAAKLTSVRRMRGHLASYVGWRGISQARAALDLACEYCRSPQEARMHLAWHLDAGHPRACCNRAVYSLDGRLLGVPDLLDREAGVVGEYDGVPHQSRARRRRDAARQSAFRGAGLETFTLVAGDLEDRDLAVTRMRAARERALWLPERDRRWTAPDPRDDPHHESLDFLLDRRDMVRSLHEQGGAVS